MKKKKRKTGLLAYAGKDGNVISVARRKDYIERMSYGELLSERRFMRAEKKRVTTARAFANRVDPRGMWVECHEIDRMFHEMIATCDYVIDRCEKEMIKRGGTGARNDSEKPKA